MTIVRSRLMLAGVLVAVVAAAFLALASPNRALAHPLGNFTVNHYSRIEVYSDVLRVQYVLDMAEIPTFQEMSLIDIDGDGAVSDAEAQSYATTKAAELGANLHLQFNDDAQTLRLTESHATLPEGQGGLQTLRLVATFEADAPGGVTALSYTDINYAGQLGWKEIVVLPTTGAALTGDFPTEDVSQALTFFPGDLTSSPLETTHVGFSFDAKGAVNAPLLSDIPIEAPAPQRSGTAFVSLINADNLTLKVIILALLAAFAFGALHAVEPGHGKTMVAAYFVGVKGTARQALTLGLIVAATHTVGVLAIGLLAIFGSQYILPEDLYPWLSLASGLMVIALGLRLIVQHSGGRIMHKISHALPFGHHHHEHDHAPAASANGVPPWKTLIAIGLADGLTPSPSALVVLLAAVSLHRIGLGIALIVSFSVGLATVLACISLGLLFFRGAMDGLSRRVSATRLPIISRIAPSLAGEGIIVRALPMAGALALVVVGVLLTLSALGQPVVSL
jgi:ABC-type nickel/cobalt efflux system permease component RcnA